MNFRSVKCHRNEYLWQFNLGKDKGQFNSNRNVLSGHLHWQFPNNKSFTAYKGKAGGRIRSIQLTIFNTLVCAGSVPMPWMKTEISKYNSGSSGWKHLDLQSHSPGKAREEGVKVWLPEWEQRPVYTHLYTQLELISDCTQQWQRKGCEAKWRKPKQLTNKHGVMDSTPQAAWMSSML